MDMRQGRDGVGGRSRGQQKADAALAHDGSPWKQRNRGNVPIKYNFIDNWYNQDASSCSFGYRKCLILAAFGPI